MHRQRSATARPASHSKTQFMQEAHYQSAAVPGFKDAGSADLPVAAAADALISAVLLGCLPAQQRAVFNGQAIRLHFSCDLAGAPELNLVPPRDFSFDFSPHDNLPREHVRLHMSVWSNGQATVCRETEFSLHHAVHE